MKFMDRIRARNALKAQGATPAEAAAAVQEQEESGAEVAPQPKKKAEPKPAPAPAPKPAPAPAPAPAPKPAPVVVDDVVIAGEKAEKPVEDMTSSELYDMTVAELRDLASEFDIDGRSSMDKAELVAALEAL